MTVILRSDQWNTIITYVNQKHEGKPLLRIWQGQGRSGGIEISLHGSTEQGRDNEVKSLLDPKSPDQSWRQILPQAR